MKRKTISQVVAEEKAYRKKKDIRSGTEMYLHLMGHDHTIMRKR